MSAISNQIIQGITDLSREGVEDFPFSGDAAMLTNVLFTHREKSPWNYEDIADDKLKLDQQIKLGTSIVFGFAARGIASNSVLSEPLNSSSCYVLRHAIRNVGVCGWEYTSVKAAMDHEDNGPAIKEMFRDTFGTSDINSEDQYRDVIWEYGLNLGLLTLERIRAEWSPIKSQLQHDQTRAWAEIEGEVAIRYMNLASRHDGDEELKQLCTSAAKDYARAAWERAEEAQLPHESRGIIKQNLLRTFEKEEIREVLDDAIEQVKALEAQLTTPRMKHNAALAASTVADMALEVFRKGYTEAEIELLDLTIEYARKGVIWFQETEAMHGLKYLSDTLDQLEIVRNENKNG